MPMRNAEEIRTRLDKIKKNNSYTEALSALADITFDIGMAACLERRDMKENIAVLHKIILGNGQPEKSMVTRLANVERCAVDIKSGIDKMQTDLTQIQLDLTGDSKNKGIIERIRDFESLALNIKRVLWLVVGVIVGQVALTLLGIL